MCSRAAIKSSSEVVQTGHTIGVCTDDRLFMPTDTASQLIGTDGVF